MNKIKLNFINESNDRNNSQILIFQKNAATSADELAVAWTVIKNCGQGERHPFTFSQEFTVDVKDAWGNYSRMLNANPGMAFEAVKNETGDALQLSSDPAANPHQIEIANRLAVGAIDANCYRDGRLCSTKTSIAPGQKAVFEFEPKIWIGVVSQVDEGDIVNEAIISNVNTQINLFGIASADIIMTGGGPGPNSTPFEFTLQNIVMA